MSAEGFFLVGLAVGLILGAFSVYGFMFAWAIRCGKQEEDGEE